ncbi:MAG: hypothetical protein EBU84_20960 [Actinobacteria bacterium]|nr:hypothetical protein [Actinomycetota bacterium]
MWHLQSHSWDGELLQDSKVLLYGAGYEHVLCTSGSPTQTLKLWVNINGTYVQRAESFPVVGDPWCPDPAYPVKHRFYWIVDWLGTASSSTRYNLDIKVTGLSSDFYIRRSVATSAGLNQEAADLARKIACLFGKITGC